MTTDVKLTFGLRDGQIIHISQLSSDEKGLNCRCICPRCESKLEARLGTIRQHHFSHYNSDDNCNIPDAQQQGLHRIALQILNNNNEILLPGWEIRKDDVVTHDMAPFLVEQTPFNIISVSGKKYSYNVASIEKSVASSQNTSYFIPDAILTIDQKDLYIEIAVTHFVDEQKLNKVNKSHISMLEIDLSYLNGALVDINDIKNAVLYNKDNRKWIWNSQHNQKLETAIKQFRNQYQLLANRYYEHGLSSLKHNYPGKNTTKKISVWDCRQETAPVLKYNELVKQYNYKYEIDSLHDDTKAMQWRIEQLRIGEYPFYMNIPIKDEFVFGCDRRIWQSYIFLRYVLQDSNIVNDTFNDSVIIKELARNSNNYLCLNKHLVDPVRIDPTIYGILCNVINYYLQYLLELGFITRDSANNYRSIHIHGLVPPNKNYAKKLRIALKQVDEHHREIDRIIDDYIKHLRI